MWHNSKTQNVTKLKKFKYDKNQKLKIWQQSKTQNETILKNLNVTKLKNTKCKKKTQQFIYNKIKQMWQN